MEQMKPENLGDKFEKTEELLAQCREAAQELTDEDLEVIANKTISEGMGSRFFSEGDKSAKDLSIFHNNPGSFRGALSDIFSDIDYFQRNPAYLDFVRNSPDAKSAINSLLLDRRFIQRLAS